MSFSFNDFVSGSKSPRAEQPTSVNALTLIEIHENLRATAKVVLGEDFYGFPKDRAGAYIGTSFSDKTVTDVIMREILQMSAALAGYAGHGDGLIYADPELEDLLTIESPTKTNIYAGAVITDDTDFMLEFEVDGSSIFSKEDLRTAISALSDDPVFVVHFDNYSEFLHNMNKKSVYECDGFRMIYLPESIWQFNQPNRLTFEIETAGSP